MYSGVGIFSVYLVAHKANSVSSAYSSGILLLGLVGKLSFPSSKFWLHALLTAATIGGITQGGAKKGNVASIETLEETNLQSESTFPIATLSCTRCSRELCRKGGLLLTVVHFGTLSML